MSMIDHSSRRFISVALLCASAFFAGGCSSRPKYDFSEEIRVPAPPPFLAGPAALLFTNANGFSAVVTMDTPASDAKGKGHVFFGQLLGQGSQLLFAPAKGDKSFIWDVQTHSGYILSEALQGYAPISSALEFTNLVITSEIAGLPSDRVNGYRGHAAMATVTGNDGSTTSFSAWRSGVLHGLPVRIETLKPADPSVINLSAVRSENLAPKFFLPPEGFTAYASGDAMAGELMTRKGKLHFAGSGDDREKLPDNPSPSVHAPGYH